MTLRRIIIGGLLAAGVWLVSIGVGRWLEQRAARATIEEFLTAVRDGEYESAVEHLTARRREALENRRKTSKPFDTAIAGLQWRIAGFEIEDGTATVNVHMEKDGFSVTPRFHLVRNDEGEWKIDRIENLFVDPAWEKRQRKRRREADEQTARELQRALKNAPGVKVRRVEPEDTESADAR